MWSTVHVYVYQAHLEQSLCLCWDEINCALEGHFLTHPHVTTQV